jgi:hypothetical protein
MRAKIYQHWQNGPPCGRHHQPRTQPKRQNAHLADTGKAQHGLGVGLLHPDQKGGKDRNHTRRHKDGAVIAISHSPQRQDGHHTKQPRLDHGA